MLDEFEKSYTKFWEAKLDGRPVESDTHFGVAKRAALRALADGATDADLAASMSTCRATVGRFFGVGSSYGYPRGNSSRSSPPV